MAARLNYYEQFPAAFGKMSEIEMALKECSLEPKLMHLVKIRASQINGCTFCIDMHVKEAIIDGETSLRLHHIAGWRESPLFSIRECAAFRWTEALTELSVEGTRDEIYNDVREQFSEREVVELSVAIAMINAWNRFGVAFRSVPGSLDAMYGLDKAGL